MGRMMGERRTEDISLQALLSSERTQRFVGSSRVGLLPSCHGCPGVDWSQEGSGAAERGLQGNYVCIQVKLVKLTARREGKHREGVDDLDMLLIDLPAIPLRLCPALNLSLLPGPLLPTLD